MSVAKEAVYSHPNGGTCSTEPKSKLNSCWGAMSFVAPLLGPQQAHFTWACQKQIQEPSESLKKRVPQAHVSLAPNSHRPDQTRPAPALPRPKPRSEARGDVHEAHGPRGVAEGHEGHPAVAPRVQQQPPGPHHVAVLPAAAGLCQPGSKAPLALGH